MRITRVELENIKSYERADFRFERGTTAIVGPNGAGKTTILEAIAWTLFDTLEYSKDDFARRGTKKGIARVTFESDGDGREYTVYRDTGNGYYIFDPGLNARIAEKKTDVGAFLRQHLGIEPGTDIKALFTSAIGVPQGAFTADFLRPASQRKASFDRLLKVEEYREGAQRLGETAKLITEKTAEARERIAGAEGQLARYDELKAERDATSARAGELEETLRAALEETRAREQSVVAFDEAERRATETRAAAERLAVEQAAAARRLADLRIELEAAQRARITQDETAEDYRAHLAALESLTALEDERAERDRAQAEVERIARLVLTAEADMRRLSDAIDAATRAQVEAEQLAPEVVKQDDLERERERLRELKAHAQAARSQLTRLDTELEALRKQHAETRENVRAAEGAGDEQATVEQLESERTGVETELSRLEQAATARQHLTAQRRDATKEVRRLKETVAALERETREIEPLHASAARADELEAQARELSDQAARLRAEIARDERTLKEVRGGVCPILGDQCLSAREGQPLDTLFKDQLAAHRARLAAVEKERARVTNDARVAREARVAVARLEPARAQLARDGALLEERENSLDSVERELAALPDGSLLQKMKFKVLGIDGELKTAREAAARALELETHKKRLKEIEAEGKRKKETREELVAASNALASLDDEIKENERALRSLKDPRARATQLRAEAAREEALRADERDARTTLAALATEKKTLDAELARFATLQTRWTETVAARERTAQSYRAHLAAGTLAATLDAREETARQAETESNNIVASATAARIEQERAAKAYDRERHAAERVALSQTTARVATTEAQLAAARERASTLAADLAKLDAIRTQLRDEFREKERLESLFEATDFVRDVLKQAGPLVTESYLYNISIEANQLFREITGDAARSLRWSKDYEIILEEGGYDRSFANLSGGEQMVAALSVRLALLKQLSDIRVAFFDEPTVNMDAERRERLAQQLGQITHFDQLFVISHDDTFEESVDHVLHVAGRDTEETATASA